MKLTTTTISLIACSLVLMSCSGAKRTAPKPTTTDGLTSRLSESHGYVVDEKGNWVPRNDKRSQYEGRGDAAYFDGKVEKKSFQTDSLHKGSWMGNKQLSPNKHRFSESNSELGSQSGYNGQKSSFDGNLRTPTRIQGNHVKTGSAHESASSRIDKPSDAETNVRRRVFGKPEIIDYKQQRDLSIRQSKQLLGREE